MNMNMNDDKLYAKMACCLSPLPILILLALLCTYSIPLALAAAYPVALACNAVLLIVELDRHSQERNETGLDKQRKDVYHEVRNSDQLRVYADERDSNNSQDCNALNRQAGQHIEERALD